MPDYAILAAVCQDLIRYGELPAPVRVGATHSAFGFNKTHPEFLEVVIYRQRRSA